MAIAILALALVVPPWRDRGADVFSAPEGYVAAPPAPYNIPLGYRPLFRPPAGRSVEVDVPRLLLTLAVVVVLGALACGVELSAQKRRAAPGGFPV